MPKPPHPYHPHQPRPNPNPKPHQPKDVPFATRLIDATNNFSLAIDASAGAVDFTFVPADDLTVTELALIFEGKGQFAFDQFFTLPALVAGIKIELQSYGQVVGAVMQTTRDMLEYASPAGFYTAHENGSSIVKATRQFSHGLTLHDRYGDYIKLTVSDDLSKLSYGIASVLGYTD